MKGNFVKLLISVLSISAASSRGWCQVIIPQTDSPHQHRIFVNIGLEPEWVTTFGYNKLAFTSQKGTSLYIGASIKVAPLLTTAGRVNFTQAIEWNYSPKWKGILNNDLYFVHNENRAGTMNGLGFDLRTAILHYGNKWVKGIEAGWQYTALTHIRHSTQTKDTFREWYPSGDKSGKGPVDGWYWATASQFRLGFTGNIKAGNHLSVQTSIGSLISVQKQGILLGFSHAQVPVYFHTQVNYVW